MFGDARPPTSRPGPQFQNPPQNTHNTTRAAPRRRPNADEAQTASLKVGTFGPNTVSRNGVWARPIKLASGGGGGSGQAAPLAAYPQSPCPEGTWSNERGGCPLAPQLWNTSGQGAGLHAGQKALYCTSRYADADDCSRTDDCGVLGPGFIFQRGGGLLALRPTHLREKTLNKRRFVGPTQTAPPPPTYELNKSWLGPVAGLRWIFFWGGGGWHKSPLSQLVLPDVRAVLTVREDIVCFACPKAVKWGKAFDSGTVIPHVLTSAGPFPRHFSGRGAVRCGHHAPPCSGFGSGALPGAHVLLPRVAARSPRLHRLSLSPYLWVMSRTTFSLMAVSRPL